MVCGEGFLLSALATGRDRPRPVTSMVVWFLIDLDLFRFVGGA